MALPIRMIHIHYRGKFLHLLDSDDQTPLYRVKVGPHSPQMEMFPVDPAHTPSHPRASSAASTAAPPICTAAFKAVSLQVMLTIHDRAVRLQRESLLTRAYNFHSPCANVELTWKADGALTGDYQLIASHGAVVARFHNRLFSNQEVGTLQLVGELEDRLRDEIVISGLAMLAMVQSLNLAGMVLVGGSVN